MRRRSLILGARGLLGRSLLRHQPRDLDVLAADRATLPLEDPAEIDRLIQHEGIDCLLLLAAWTRVDDCEGDPERAFRTNGILPGRIAGVAAKRGVALLHLSTDYVFDGTAGRPYREYDPVAPLSVYGRSKWYGECSVRAATSDYRIVRTSGLYGPGGPDFVHAIRARLGQERIPVVDDQTLSPTLVDDLAPLLWRIALAEETGTYHVASSGEASWYQFARRIAELSGHDPDRIVRAKSADLARPAARPTYSVLDTQAARDVYGVSLPSWEDGIARFVQAGQDERPSGDSAQSPGGESRT